MPLPAAKNHQAKIPTAKIKAEWASLPKDRKAAFLGVYENFEYYVIHDRTPAQPAEGK